MEQEQNRTDLGPAPPAEPTQAPFLQHPPESAAARAVAEPDSPPLEPVAEPVVRTQPASWPAPPPDGAPDTGTVDETRAAAAGRHRAAGGVANPMLALVCWIAAATSIFEAYALYTTNDLRTYAFSGYLALGFGVLLFSFDAAGWTRRRGWFSWLFAAAVVLTLIGVFCLLLTHAPGRRI